MKTQTKALQEEANVNGNDYPKEKEFDLQPYRHTVQPVRKTIIARENDAYVPLMISNIALFISTKKTVTAIDFEGRLYTIESTLSDIENKVGSRDFFRVNRNIILHFAAIKLFHIISFGKIKVKLVNPEWLKEEVQISQYMAPRFRDWISGI
jgi:DNA-binding LytR/AlgR family response regulator